MQYADKKFGFSYEIPIGWKHASRFYCWTRDKRSVIFPMQIADSRMSPDVRMCSFMQSGWEAGMSIVCLKPDADLADHNARSYEMIQQVRRAGATPCSGRDEFAFRHGDLVDHTRLRGGGLAGEENTALIWFSFPYQLALKHEILKISSVHEGIDYILTFGGPTLKFVQPLKTILDSFRFGRDRLEVAC
jgi:hypothetical protein